MRVAAEGFKIPIERGQINSIKEMKESIPTIPATSAVSLLVSEYGNT